MLNDFHFSVRFFIIINQMYLMICPAVSTAVIVGNVSTKLN
jgi:hypothetical protein